MASKIVISAEAINLGETVEYVETTTPKNSDGCCSSPSTPDKELIEEMLIANKFVSFSGIDYFSSIDDPTESANSKSLSGKAKIPESCAPLLFNPVSLFIITGAFIIIAAFFALSSTLREVLPSPIQLSECTITGTEISQVHHNLEDTEAWLSALMFYVIPCIAFFAITGNIVTIRVLVYIGLRSSHNVLLVGMASSDLTFLSAMFLYGVTAKAGCLYLKNKDSLYYGFENVLKFMDHVGYFSSFMMTILIIGERVEVFLDPFKGKLKLSWKTYCFSISFVYIFAIIWTIFLIAHVLHERIEHTYKSCKNESAQCPFKNSSFCAINLAWFRNNIDSSELSLKTHLDHYIFYGPLPISVTLIGCIAIAVKTIRIRSKMIKMTNTEVSVLRPTFTALVICCVYTVCSFAIFLIDSGIIRNLYADCGTQKLKLDVIMLEVKNVFIFVHCSANFIIYFVTNVSYRLVLEKLYFPRYSKLKHSSANLEQNPSPKLSDRLLMISL